MPLTDREITERERNLFVREAIAQYPGAAGMEDFLTGSEDEILDKAQRLHERARSRDDEPDARQRAVALYGRSGTGGLGGGALPPPGLELDNERWEQRFIENFNSAPRDVYGQRLGLPAGDVDRYTRQRLAGHVVEQVSKWAAVTRSDWGARSSGRRP